MATNWKAITLINFSDAELLLDAEETRAVLIFFFPSQEKDIRIMGITNQYRSFAQGLMVAAIDATYAIGWMEIITKGYCKPAGSIKGALNKLGREGAKHWFKHAKKEDLADAKIAESVRKEISRRFSKPFEIMRTAETVPLFHTVYISRSLCRANGEVFWG